MQLTFKRFLLPVCLGDMMAELVDEMPRRGFDPETSTFAIDRR